MQSELSSVGVNCSATFEVSNNGVKYGQGSSTLNTGCKPRNGGMLNSKALSPIALVMVYDPYQSGRSLWWGPVSLSFCKCNQTLSPTWNSCGTQCWSCHCLYLVLDFSRMSWTYWWMWWICSTNLVALSTSAWAWEDSSCMDASDKSTSIGANGWKPKHAWKGLWLVELCRPQLYICLT